MTTHTNASFEPLKRQPLTLESLPVEFEWAPGSQSMPVDHVAPLDLAQSGAFAFLSNPKYRNQLFLTHATVVAITQEDYDWLQTQEAQIYEGSQWLICKSPYLLFAHIASSFYIEKNQTGIRGQFVSIGADSQVPSSASLHDGVRIGARVVIGERVELKSGVVIGDDVTIGADTLIYPNVTVYERCLIGQRNRIHAGVVIGADGFGFAPSPNGWVKIPQVGRVIIHDDVEIGANTTIDRGALADTVIKSGVKLDNQIQIGHNCEIGENTAIAASAALGGSTRIGRDCMVGGGSLFAGHLSVADKTIFSGGSAVLSSVVEPGARYTGIYPILEHNDWRKSSSLIGLLPSLRKRIRDLEMLNEDALAKK